MATLDNPRYRGIRPRPQGVEPPNPMGAMTEPPNPTGAVGGGDFQSKRMGPGGDLMGGRTAMPGGQPPSPNGFRPFQPMSGQQGMGFSGRKPGMGPQRPGVAPRPMAPPPPPPPPPVMPPGGTTGEPPNPTAGLMPSEGSLMDQTFLPGDDKRLQGAQGATDAAMRTVTQGPSYSNRAGMGAGRYRQMFGSGEVSAEGVNPDVPFESVDPEARFRRMDTSIAGGPDVPGADQGRYLSEQDAALQGLGGPSRTALAQQTLRDFEAQGERGLAQRFRKVGQTAAKFGRIGMGDVNAELGSIQGDFERDRLQKQNELAASVAEGDISDRFRRVGAVSGLRGQEADIGAGLRGEQRLERGYDDDIALGNIGRAIGERDTELGLTERNIGRRMGERDARLGAGERAYGRRAAERDTMTGLRERNQDRAFDRARSAVDFGGRDAAQDIGNEFDRLNAAGQLEDRVFGQGQQNRGEFRTERGYQQARRQQSLDDRIRQRELENAEQQQRLLRAQMLLQSGGRTPSLDQLLGG